MRKLRRKSEIDKIENKKIIKYKDQRCLFRNKFRMQCKRDAVGKSTLCEKHGGIKIIEEALISIHEEHNLVPTKFDNSVHPLQFIQLSTEGLSEVEIAAEFGVSVNTLKKWSEKYKEFNTAWEIGQACHESWWLRQGKNNLSNTRFQAGLYKFLTTNKLGYAEKIETKSHNINENVGVLLIPGQMSVEEWETQNRKDDGEEIQGDNDIIDI